jgi:DNA polymerase-3 subunit alpha
MRQEFEQYLRRNLMSYTEVSPYVYEIDGRTFELYKPDNDGALFDDDFRFTGIPANLARYTSTEKTVDTQCDFYAYKFGGVWYMLPRDDRDKVKLKRLKYLGEAVQEIPTPVFMGVHGQYEIMSGSGTYADWCAKAKFYGVTTLGICEKNTLSGALKFQVECQKNGLKPVIGMECTVYDIVKDFRFTAKVFVRNEVGWQSILTMSEAINCDNPGYIPIDQFREEISRNAEGLVVVADPKTTDYDRFAEIGLKMDYYQLDPVRYVEESRDEVYLKNLRKFYHSGMLALPMADAWYLDEEYSCIRSRLASIGGSNFYDSDDQWFKPNDVLFCQLADMFPNTDDGLGLAYQDFLDALERLMDIADSIDFTVDTTKRHLPRYIMTEEEAAKYTTNEDMFWGLIDEGLQRHPELIEQYGEDVVMERIDREVGVIKLGDTIDYFLITRDIINWCHRNGIMTGISRGSAGGCLVSYLLAITKLDPIGYNLLFERFLNEGRVKKSLPDVDVDFPGEDRGKVKEYMEQRFGEVNVCSVGTYSALQLRAAIKDMSRVYGLEFQEVNDMMKLFAVDDRKPEDLFRIACAQPRVKKFVREHPDLVNEVMLIMPAPKARSVHACATMIFPKEHDMFHWTPIRKQNGEYVTEWEGGEMDGAGFLKNDILGIKQLDKFQNMVRLVKENEGVDVDIFNVPLDDPEVYRYFQNGWTEDNFHFGSRGLTGYCKEMKPENIEDLIAAIALYRPGAMENGFHTEYVKRKEGAPVSYWVGSEEALKTTYGLVVYQEEVMELTRTLGGLSLVEADDVRKAMVKKKYEALAQYHPRFVDFYVQKWGVTKEYAENVWDALDKASSYLFNRSHAVAYALTGYISQWMKVHYPIEYWSVAFKEAMTEDYPRYIAEINKTGVCMVRPVDINLSGTGVYIDFAARTLYWSVTGVKQVAEKAATQILKERDENGRYWSLDDFVTRHKWKGSAVNTRVVQNLILAGAFDDVENITDASQRVELLISYLASTKNKLNEADPIITGFDIHRNDAWWWQLMQKKLSGLAFFDYAGLYDKVKQFFPVDYEYHTFEECSDVEYRPNRGYVIVGGYVSAIDLKKTKKGDILCRITLENNYEFLDLVVFQTEYERLQEEIAASKDNIVLLNATLYYDARNDKNALRADMETSIVTFKL